MRVDLKNYSLPIFLSIVMPLCDSTADAAVRLRRSPAGFLTETSANRPTTVRVGEGRGPATLRAEILLDRAGFSPGQIDATYDQILRTAILAFQKSRGLTETGIVDEATWAVLDPQGVPVLQRYIVTAQDAAGPFLKIPQLMRNKAKLPALGYESLIEALGERFHCSPGLLRTLNPEKSISKAGEELVVPDVLTSVEGKATLVVVDRSERSLSAFGEGEALLAWYPISSGSKHDPLPIGTWKINGVARAPVYNYNPKLFWDAPKGDTKATVAAGPNNPVGIVWIDLSKDHYGIHGTPEPSSIGKSYSHGCIRLTNWDAAELGRLVSPGVKVVLQE